MTKNHTKAVVKSLVSSPAFENLEDLDSAFGPLVPQPTKAPTKEDIRDYQRTPEVNALLERFGDKSKAIRGLNAEGYKRGQIANMLRIRYQHVNNVLNQK
jgi:hypothetical protein